MSTANSQRAFTRADLLAAIIAVVLLTAVVIPVIAGGRGDAMIEESMNNLKLLGFAHVLYAAEWDGRRVGLRRQRQRLPRRTRVQRLQSCWLPPPGPGWVV